MEGDGRYKKHVFHFIILSPWYRNSLHMGDKVFKNGPSKIYGRQPLKNLKGYGLLKPTISLQIFEGCRPQILLGPFLITLFHMPLVSE